MNFIGMIAGAVLLSVVCLASSAIGQTVFSYGNQKVDKKEFLHVYNKNAEAVTHTKESVEDYLKLYAIYKMKVAEAKSLGYDKNPQMLQEFEYFKSQITPQYLVHEEYINQNLRISDANSRKEILLGIIPTGSGEEGKTAAAKAFEELKNGSGFKSIAKKYSVDTEITDNEGVAGYITAFTLPYQIERIVFALPEGGYSEPVKLNEDWYLFSNLHEQKANGTLTVAQILLAYPPDYTAADKQVIAGRADSVYQLLLNGANFSELAIQLSDDIHSAEQGGQLAPFKAGDYSSEFCNRAFSLKADGDISRPFETAFGFHIVKRIHLAPIPEEGDKNYELELKNRVMNDPVRMKEAKKQLAEEVKTIIGYQLLANSSQLQQASLQYLSGSNNNVCNNKDLAKFGDGSTVACSQWKAYLDSVMQFHTASVEEFDIAGSFQGFQEEAILQYYSNHLYDYNEEYRLLLNEFREGNLLFEIMQKNVWEKAMADTAGQIAYFNRHTANYQWNDGADMIVFSTYDTTAVDELKNEVRQHYADWRFLLENFSGNIQADSGRYEFTQLPFKDASTTAEKSFTENITNDFDESHSFAFIIKKRPGGDTKSFEAAKGFVMLDYQQQIENLWVKELMKKYPVKVNKKELKKIISELGNR